MNSWLQIPNDSDFTLENLPFGIFTYQDNVKKVGVAVGEFVIDLNALQCDNLLVNSELPKNIFISEFLNAFISTGKNIWSFVRARITDLLTDSDSALKKNFNVYLIPIEEVKMHLPIQIGDYTDFYASLEHATNVGSMFRDPAKALMPNWKHLPVAYHGRSSSIGVSGDAIIRPKGQVLSNGMTRPEFIETKALDFELEMGCVIGKKTEQGDSVSVDEVDDFIFGMVMFNDWSARDIQKWEYVPLGPFLGKNFASSISPWVVTLEALKPFKTKNPEQDVPVLPYLQRNGNQHAYDIKLSCWLKTKEGTETKLCESNHKYLYWTVNQQLAHHTVNGCNINIGDLIASGTISGEGSLSYGSFLELTWNGEQPIKLADGSERKFLADYDTIIMKAKADNGNLKIGFGELINQILPAKK